MRSIRKIGYSVALFDPSKKYFNEIDKSKVDIIFNALHGKGGEDGIAQSYFEYLRIPYTHSGVISSMNAMDKVISKKFLKRIKILTPKYFVLKKNEFNKKIQKIIKKINLNFQ